MSHLLCQRLVKEHPAARNDTLLFSVNRTPTPAGVTDEWAYAAHLMSFPLQHVRKSLVGG